MPTDMTDTPDAGTFKPLNQVTPAAETPAVSAPSTPNAGASETPDAGTFIPLNKVQTPPPAKAETGNLSETEQPGFAQRAIEASGAGGMGSLIGQEAGYIGTMPARTYHRIQGLNQAYDALKRGDLKKAASIAHMLAAGPNDPVSDMAKNLIKLPFEEAVEAYRSFRDTPDKVAATLSAAQHGIRSVPLIGSAAEQVGSAIAEDLHNNNWSGLSGDIVGVIPALLMGSEGRAADAAEASGAEGAAEAAEGAKTSAIRPSQRAIGRTQVPVTALQAEDVSTQAKVARELANNPAAAQAKFAAERTQPAAVNATVSSLEDVARNHIQTLRDQLNIHDPFEADMSTLRKQSAAMKDSAQEVYQRFDKASEEEQATFDQHQAEKKAEFKADQDAKKAAAKTADKEFKPETFVPDERPQTFAEMQTTRADALKAMRQGSPEAYKAAKADLEAVEKKMDVFAKEHDDLVSPEEYSAANAARRAAGQHDFIADRLNIDEGTDQIPASITKGSLKSLPRSFDKRYGEGAFEKYLGPEGMQNYNAVRDVLESPSQRDGFMNLATTITRHSVGAGLGYLAGGPGGALAGAAIQHSIGRIAENLLFNPEYGQTMLATWRASQRLANTGIAAGTAISRPPVLAAPVVAPLASRNVTHTWNPNTGIVPVQ